MTVKRKLNYAMKRALVCYQVFTASYILEPWEQLIVGKMPFGCKVFL